MRFTVDPWDPSYGAAVESELARSTTEVDAGVEVPPERWAAVDPQPGVVAPETVLFVDGVRRTDAQAWIDGSPALAASYAAGVVCCCPEGGAHLADAQVGRGLFGTVAGAEVHTTAGPYSWTQVAAKSGQDPVQALGSAVQVAMGELELLVAARTRERHGAAHDLLVIDGPLRGRHHLARALGFVKTHGTTYLPAELNPLVAALRAGQRTPVFRLGEPGADPLLARHTWYLRLPGPPGAPWAGIARVECGGQVPVPEAVALADQSQVTLVRYASVAYKDARAPQNLVPIAGLERALRRRLGEPALLYRALRRAAHAAGSADAA